MSACKPPRRCPQAARRRADRRGRHSAIKLLGRQARRAQTALTSLPSAGDPAVNVTIWPAIVADKKGFFAEQGLLSTSSRPAASARSLQQVAAGSAPIGSLSAVSTPMRAIGGGAPGAIFLNSAGSAPTA